MINSVKNILLVEDDLNLGTILKDFLSIKGYKVTHCLNGKEGEKAYNSASFNLVLLDVMMPKLDGFTLAEKIRKNDKNTPIIFLTAKSMLEDRLKGLKLGADDYITKPFSSEELSLRIENIFKRTAQLNPAPSANEKYTLGSFEFDYVKRKLETEGTEHKLTSKEAELLRLLAINKNSIVERSFALKKIWNNDSYFAARSMDVFIAKLRSYLKADGSVQILNVHGTGFKLIA